MTNRNSDLRKDFDYFVEHHEELVKEYDGKFIVIKDCSVVGVYDDELKAVTESQKQYESGTFLVQYVAPGSASYSQSFHSRVAFS